MAVLLASCGSVQRQEETALAQAGAARPVWRAGDKWVYAWSSGTEKGVKTSEVLGVRDIRGVQYHVVRMAPVDVYFTADLHWAWAASVAESRVTARAVPPLPWFTWPLQVGKKWEYRGVLEDRQRKDPVRDAYKVVGVEEVKVPAGTFRAIKIVRETGTGVADQYWYAPEVRWYVKWVGKRGNDEFQEVLQEHVAGPQANVRPRPGETPTKPQ